MVLTAFCLLASHSGTALDYVPPRVAWLNWSVDYSYNGDQSVYPAHSYFIGNMLDGDTATAWMVGGTQVYSSQQGAYVPDFETTIVPTIFVVLPKAMRIDGIRIMPGYNKSPEVFKMNHRITSVALYADEQSDLHSYMKEPFANAKLNDEMGWQHIKFAPRDIGTLRIEIKDWVKGADNDFCISEIQLLSDGKPVDWQLTPLLLSTSGSECGCGTAWHVVNRTGKVIRSAGTNEFDSYSSDATGRYVFSNALTQNFFQFYVLDMLKDEFIAHADRPRTEGWWVSQTEVTWKNGSAIAKVSWDVEGSAAKEETITLKWTR